MPSEAQIIAWKSNAWKDAGTVAAYASRYAEPSGPDFLKAGLERSLIARHLAGRKLVDVGIGTGRASLGLAAGGYTITGVDNSAAMLKKCRSLAGPTRIDLVEADLAELPFSRASFESLISLDTLIHFPHWQRILSEWQRVIVPGGRILFDIGSMDHQTARAGGSDGSVVGFTLQLSVAELCEYATRQSMRVAAVIPYGMLSGSAAPNRFFSNTPLGNHAWDRLLSWATVDPRFFAFLVFLEEDVVQKLPAVASSRCFIVLENTADAQHNAGLGKRMQAAMGRLQGGFNAATASELGVVLIEARRKLNEHMVHEPNRFALYRMLFTNLDWNWPLPIADFISAEWLAEAHAILSRATVDRDLTRLISDLHTVAPLDGAFDYRGVDLGASWEVEMMAELLEGPLGAFNSALRTPLVAGVGSE